MLYTPIFLNFISSSYVSSDVPSTLFLSFDQISEK